MRYLATNSLKWNPNSFMPTLLHSEKPLLDNTNTPRGQKRAITLDRCFDKFAWMYNRTSPDRFDGHQIAKDKAKSKILRKQLKKSRKKMVQQMVTSPVALSGGDRGSGTTPSNANNLNSQP
jgi:hypothetical protein